MARRRQDTLASEETRPLRDSEGELFIVLPSGDYAVCNLRMDEKGSTEHRLCQTVKEVLEAELRGRIKASIRISETYTGEVVRVHGDRVVVVYEVGHDLVEQTYVREQFIDGKLPKKGDRLAVYVHVVEVPPGEEAASSKGAGESGQHDEPPKRRKNVVPLPRTF